MPAKNLESKPLKHYNIPVFISHFGCPNSCVFCNQKKINGRETDVTAEDVVEIIEEYLESLPKESIKEVAFFGGTFTGISKSLQEEYLKTVKNYMDRGLIDGIRMSTRPDYISRDILEMLVRYNVTTIELGVQSMDSQVLRLSGRGYEPSEVYRASELIKEYGIKLGIQLMPGLPGSTYVTDLNSAREVLDIKPDMVRIYPTLVISGTAMEGMYRTGRFEPMTLEEAVERIVPIYALFEGAGINIIRVGLQPSDDLREDGVIIAGPFHPAFRELVEARIYGDFLERFQEEEEIVVEAHEKNISKITGIKKVNKVRFGRKLIIRIDRGLSLREVRINGKVYTRLDILGGVIHESDNN